MILSLSAPYVLLAAIILDALVGDPDWIWRRIPHPAAVMGRVIGSLERVTNISNWSFAVRRASGVATLVVLVTFAAAIGFALHRLLAVTPGGLIAETVIVAVLLAGRSLDEHVARVATGFEHGGLAQARAAVSMIVGRDPESLDEAGVSRAAIETLAENFSDGLVAPAFWYLVAGLPGIITYKLINTADSMIGHRSERYRAYGWAAARLDDVVNLVPARLSGLAIVAAVAVTQGSVAARNSLAAMWQDAPRHKSPNAGWPEAAMAGALGLALAGPRRYGGTLVDDHWMNSTGRQAATPVDIRRALAVYRGAQCATAIAAGLAAII